MKVRTCPKSGRTAERARGSPNFEWFLATMSCLAAID